MADLNISKNDRVSVQDLNLKKNFNSGLIFDGVTARVTTANYNYVQTGTGFSAVFSFWIKTTTTATQCIMSKQTDTNAIGSKEFEVLLIAGQIRLQNSGGGNSVSTGTVNDGKWHFVLIEIIDQSCTYYIDDVSNGTNTQGNSTQKTEPLLIGARKTTNTSTIGNYFSGSLDDVKIYTRSFSSQEKTDAFNGIEPSTTNLVAHYKFDEGSGSTANDSGSNAKNGTITAATYITDVPTNSIGANLIDLATTSDSSTISENTSVELMPVTLTVSVSDSINAHDYRKNLIPNPTFESGTSEWALETGYTRSSADAYSGTWSVRLSASSGFANFTTENDANSRIAVLANTVYTFSFYYKLTITSGVGPNLEIRSDQPFAGSLLGSSSLTAAASWTRKTITFTSNSSGFVSFRMYNNNGNVLGYFDAFQLELGEATSYFDGSLTGASWDGTANLSASTAPSIFLTHVDTLAVSDSITVSESATVYVNGVVLSINVSDTVTVTESVSVFAEAFIGTGWDTIE